MVNGSASLISLYDFSSLAYRNAKILKNFEKNESKQKCPKDIPFCFTNFSKREVGDSLIHRREKVSSRSSFVGKVVDNGF